MGFEHLNGNTTYKKLLSDPLTDTVSTIKNILLVLRLNQHISEQLYNNLIPLNAKLGRFRILPKLHKDKFNIRPIINCNKVSFQKDYL